MKRCALFALVATLVVGCTSPAPTPTPQPTYTPLPTYTPYPTSTPPIVPTSGMIAQPLKMATPKSTSLPQLTAPAEMCIAWKEAAAHMNETRCVRGTVANTNLSGSTFFIDFDNTRASFYGVSFKYTWDNLKGKCVEISGKISPYNGRPQIVIDKQEQLKMCAN